MTSRLVLWKPVTESDEAAQRYLFEYAIAAAESSGFKGREIESAVECN